MSSTILVPVATPITYARPHELLVEGNLGLRGCHLREEGRKRFNQIEKTNYSPLSVLCKAIEALNRCCRAIAWRSLTSAHDDCSPSQASKQVGEKEEGKKGKREAGERKPAEGAKIKLKIKKEGRRKKGDGGEERRREEREKGRRNDEVRVWNWRKDVNRLAGHFGATHAKPGSGHLVLFSPRRIPQHLRPPFFGSIYYFQGNYLA